MAQLKHFHFCKSRENLENPAAKDALESGVDFSYLIGGWLLTFSVGVCFLIFFLTWWTHVRKNRLARTMGIWDPLFEDLVKSVRFGSATDEEIKKTVFPKNFRFFFRYLQRSISSVEKIDVRTEKYISDVSGFTGYLEKIIGNTRKWEKTLAVRLLAGLRDARHIPLFRKILIEDSFVQTAYAAGLGLALCKDVEWAEFVARRLWRLSEENHDPLLLILRVYGKEIAPLAVRDLEQNLITDKAKPVVLDFLTEIRYAGAAGAVAKMLQRNPEDSFVDELLVTLREVGGEEHVEAVLPYLNHAEFPIRVEAVLTVATLGGERTQSYLEKCLSDENWWVRREAAKSMARTGAAGVSRLQALAQQKDQAGSTARMILAELQFNRVDALAY